MNLSEWLRLQWDRVGAWLAIVAGLVALVAGWIGVSGAAFIEEQLPYLVSGGVGGLFLLGLGSTLWLSADLRDEWRELNRIEAKLDRNSREDRLNGAASSPLLVGPRHLETSDAEL